MKNKIIIGSVVLLALSGLIYITLNTNNNQQNKIINKSINLNPSKGIMCTQKMSVGGNGNAVTSTIYIFGNKMRYDSSLTQEVSGQKDIHMISDGEYSYMWGKGIIANALGGKHNTGVKMKTGDENKSFAPNINIDDLKKNNFHIPGTECKEWTPDQSLLTIPKNIEFMSMENMMNPSMINSKPPTNTNQANTNIPNTNLCEMCNMIPDPQSKTDCLKSCEEDNK